MSLPETVPATARIELANRIVEASRLLVSRGMNRGASGNISIRNKMTPSAMDGFLITPSGIDPAKMTSNTICQMNMAGEHEKNVKPSTEWRIHRDIYLARPEINAVIHTHTFDIRDNPGMHATGHTAFPLHDSRYRRQYHSLRTVCPVRKPTVVGYCT